MIFRLDSYFSNVVPHVVVLRCFSMSKEIPLQRDMFTGELVDTRSRKQKKRDEQRRQLQQTELFSQREVAQFGVRANPKIPLSPKTRIELAAEDLRTEEEKAADERRAQKEKTYKLFPPGQSENGSSNT